MRSLTHPLFASLAAHGLLLGLLALLVQPVARPVRRAIEVTIRPAPPRAEALPAPSPPAPVSLPAPSVRPSPPAPPKLRVVTPLRSVAPSPIIIQRPPSAVALGPSVPGLPAPPSAAGTSGRGIGTESRGTSGSTTGWSIYLEHIRRRIERTKSYPAAARDAGIEGSVLLRLQIDGQGRVQGVRVLRSDDELLTESARSAVTLAAPFPPPPHEEPARPLELDIPLRFRMEDAQ